MPSPAAARILIADDQPDVLEALRLLLKGEGYQIDSVESPAAVLTALERREYDVVADRSELRARHDVRAGGARPARAPARGGRVAAGVVMTAWGSVNLAVEAMRRGARDFVEKPWDNERLLTIVRTQTELGRALRRSTRLEAQAQAPGRRHAGAHRGIAGDAARPPGDRARRAVRRERAHHRRERHRQGTRRAGAARGSSGRAARPMVTINAGGVSEGVFESELFGHVKGAFTDAKQDRIGRFELADGGTLFLDEIANVSAQPAAEAAARAGDRRVRAARVVQDAQGGRAPDLGDQRRPRRRSRRRPVPPGPALPSQHDRDPAAAAARPARRHPAAREALPGRPRARATARR